jgi:hypothetical protein
VPALWECRLSMDYEEPGRAEAAVKHCSEVSGKAMKSIFQETRYRNTEISLDPYCPREGLKDPEGKRVLSLRTKRTR